MNREQRIITISELKPRTLYFSKKHFIVLLRLLNSSYSLYKECGLSQYDFEDLDSLIDYISKRC